MKCGDIMEVNKNRINYHNKDTRIKIELHNHGNMLLRHIGIDDEIKEIEPQEMTTLEGKNLKLDFRAKLKSGKRLDVEGESNVVRDPALEKSLEYLIELYCQTREDVISIIMVLAEGNNKKIFDKKDCITFKPYLLEIKKCDGEKYLNICKKKIEDNKSFTEDECGIIDLIPEMKFNRNMGDVVEELCYVIKDGKIPKENRRELTTIINLSIDYYITDKEKREKLTEMLKMDDAFIPEYNRIIRESIKEGREEGREEGIVKGEKNGKLDNIENILKEISENPEITVEDIRRILENKKKTLLGK